MRRLRSSEGLAGALSSTRVVGIVCRVPQTLGIRRLQERNRVR
jgi:hypothetical protein